MSQARQAARSTGWTIGRPSGATSTVGPVGALEWRAVDWLGVDTLHLVSYNTFADGAPPTSSPNVVRFDNVVVSREPVGCLR